MTDADAAQTAESRDRLISVALEGDKIARTPEVEQERKVAVFDLLEANSFRLTHRDDAPPGPYALILGLRERRLVFDVRAENGEAVTEFVLSLSPLRKVIKDYFAICESYFDAIKKLTSAQIEAIDMGRRGIHNEGAQLLKERLEGKVAVDDNTARRLFTLVSVLHFRG